MKKLKYLLLSACALSMTAAFVFAACSDGDKPDDNIQPEEPSTFVEDTNNYYAIGTGAGDLSASSWNMNYTGLSFVKDTSVTDANVYTLSMKMYAGDHFQIIHDATWNGQMGMSYVSGAVSYGSLAYVTFDGDNNMELFGGGDYGMDIEAAQGGVYTFTLTTYPGSADLNTITYTRVVNYDMTVRGDVSEVGMTDNGGKWEYVLIVGENDLKRDAQGAVVAEGAEYAAVQVYNAAKSQGYYLAEGDYTAYDDSEYSYVNLLSEGAYYITYSESLDNISITPTAHDIEIRGIKTPVKMAIGEGAWTATVGVTAADYAEGAEYANVILYDRITDSDIGTMQLTEGTYAVRYTEDGGVEYEALAYYLVGTFANAGWNISENSVELQATDRNGVYNAVFMLADMTESDGWLTEQGGTDENGNTAIFAFRVVYGSKLNGIAEWCDAGNTFVYEAGEATVTFVKGYGISVSLDTSKDGTEYVEDTNLYGLAGTINGWNNRFEDKLAFVKDETVTDNNVYTLTVTLAANAEIKVVLYDSWENAMGSAKVTGIGTDLVDSDGNIKVVTAGEYTFTLTTYPNNPALNTIAYTWEEKTTDEYVEDTNLYGLAGTINGWNNRFEDELAFVKDETVTDNNVYTLTVTLAANAEFKVVLYDSWENAMGSAKVTGIGTDLVDSDGNIKVVTAGEYTFTLTTYPEDVSQNAIAYTVNPSVVGGEDDNEEGGNTDSETGVNAYHLVGSGSLFGDNSWNTGYAEYAFTKTSDNVYTVNVTLAEGDVFKVVKGDGWSNQIDSSAIQDIGTDLVDSDGNIKVVTAGNYTLTITIGEGGAASLAYELA